MTDEQLPVVLDGDTEQYIQVTPAEDNLQPETCQRQLRRVYNTISTNKSKLSQKFSQSNFARLLGKNKQPSSVECLLLSPGKNSEIIEYYFTINGEDGTLDGLKRTLQVLFPDSYDITSVEQVVDIQGDIVTIAGTPHRRQTYSESIGVEYVGDATRRTDWQTQLAQFGESNTRARDSKGLISSNPQTQERRSPLTYLLETMVDTELPVIYQVLMSPLPTLQSTLDRRIDDLNTGRDRWLSRIFHGIYATGEPYEPSESDKLRQRQIRERMNGSWFVANIRLVILATEQQYAEAQVRAEEFQDAFGDINGEFHKIKAKVRTERDAEQLLDDISDSRIYHKNYQRLWTYLPGTTNQSRGIVVDPYEVPHLFAVDGQQLTPDARRALETTPKDQTSIPRPPRSVLNDFGGPGLDLGYSLNHDGEIGERISLPPERQTEHAAIIGGTGTGKSVSLISGILSNRRATAGANIIIDPKGGRFPQEYLRSHYAETGSLEDVYYFDLAEWLPAISFFDVQTEIEAGVPREVAVDARIAHYEEVLKQIMGQEQYEQAVRSPQLIKDTLRTLYDSDHGSNRFEHRDLHRELRRMAEEQTVPPVGDDDLSNRLRTLIGQDGDMSDNVIQGALTRIEEISGKSHLNRIFNHDPKSAVQFEFGEYLNEDVTLIFDTGRLRSEVQQGLAIVILSQLWTALQRRRRRNPERDLPLVNLYLEEAASIGDSALLDQFLSQGREFAIALTLAMQFPAQLEDADKRAYQEVINDVGTYLTGRVSQDEAVAQRFATETLQAPDIARRLGSLSRGQWLVDLPGAFFEQKPTPFLLESLELPDGHPDKQPTPPAGYQNAKDAMVNRTLESVSLQFGSAPAETSDQDETPAESEAAVGAKQLPKIFELTNKMPECVSYNSKRQTLVCTECNRQYAPITTGMRDAIDCCHSFADVESDNVPICSHHLKLSPTEVAESEWGIQQLIFLQVVHNAQQQRYDRIEYDIVHDSMLHLIDYVGINRDAVNDLKNAGLLKHDSDHLHRLYSITKDGRDLINERYRRGIDFGHLQGDLGESSQHVCGVEIQRRYFEQEYVNDPDHPVDTVQPYYQLDESDLATDQIESFLDASTEDYVGRVLDIAGLDSDGNIIIAAEIERINHDHRTAVVKDYDTIAACDPEEAHWLVMKQNDGSKILKSLRQPLDGTPRVEKSYAPTTPPRQFRIDSAGLTDISAIKHLRKQL